MLLTAKAALAIGDMDTAGKAIQDTAITPNVLVADTDEDAPLPDEHGDSVTPIDENKTKTPQTDEQLRKAMDVLKKRG